MGFLTSGIPQGLNQASDTLLRTGMGMMHYNQNKLIQDQAMKIRQEEADRERIAFERQEAAIKEQEAKYNAVVPASKYFSKIREFPSYRQSLIEGFEALNLPYEETPDGDVIGKYGHGMEVMKWIYASGERAEKQAKGVFGDLQNKKMTLLEQLPTVKKPEEAKAIQDQIAQISEQQAQVIGSTWDVQKKIAEEQGKPPKAPTQVIVGDEIKYRDENGNFVEGLGGPRYKPSNGDSGKEAKRDAREAKKEQLKIYDDAIKDYDHNIEFAKGQLRNAQIYDSQNPGEHKYEDMVNAINENQKQRDITASRRRDYLSGKKSTQPKQETAKKKVGTKNGVPVYELPDGNWQVGD